METIKEKRLRLWKARQEAEGIDVSSVKTLEDAEKFFAAKPQNKATNTQKKTTNTKKKD